MQDHRKWIADKGDIITELKAFRDKQIAHLDVSAVRNHFDGEIAGVTNIEGVVDFLKPTIVEKSATLLEKIIEIVGVYTQYHADEVFDLKYMRQEIRKDCHKYMQYRLKEKTSDQQS